MSNFKAGVTYCHTVLERNRPKFTFNNIQTAPTAGLLGLKWKSNSYGNKGIAKVLI